MTLYYKYSLFSFAERPEIVEMLIENGVDRNLKDKNGDTALNLAEQKKILRLR